MIKEIKSGIGSYFEAHAFIRKHKLWVFVLIPGVINFILISILLFTTWHFTEIYTLKLLAWVGIEKLDWGWFDWLSDALYYLMLFLFRILIMAVYFKFYKYIVLIIMAPVMAFMSERTEELLNKDTYPFKWKVFVNNIFRGIGLAVRNIFLEILLTLFIFSLAFIPIIAFIVPILLFLVEGYFYGFSMMDYYNERKNLNVKESSRFVWKHKWLAITNGGVFVALMLIPIVGIMIGPTYSVVAATLATNNLYGEDGKG